MPKKRWMLVAGVALPALYLVAWPLPIDPIAWTPPAAPELIGVLAPNRHFADVERLDLPFGFGPEDVAVDTLGRIYAGLQDGQIVRMAPDGSGTEIFADTGGRPLGLAIDGRGNLIVADAFEGLLSVSEDGTITVLSTEAGGVALGFTDDVDIAPDGVIYFSDASTRFDQHHYMLDIFESRPNGRLLAYDPRSSTTRVVVDSLFFANGVAVSPGGQFVLVNETTRYRVLRHWLQGPRSGQTEVFIENLPGFPDGISRGTDGAYWLALINPRNGLLDALGPWPFARKVVARLPEVVRPKAVRHAFVLGLGAEGQVVHNLQDAEGERFAHITSVEQVGGVLYLGSLEESALARIAAPR